MPAALQDLLIAAALLVLLFLSLEMGYRAGKRSAREPDARAGSQIGTIQGAILGLLGLLLAFSFAAAGSRFLERQDLIVQEANTIGTAYLRADLLEEPARSRLRGALKDYTQHRVALSARLRHGITPQDTAEISRLQAEMWSAAVEGARANPVISLALLAPVNDVIDLHSTRVFASKKRLPLLVLALLIACSALSLEVIGFGAGTAGHRRASLTLSLLALIWTSLWITIDLDRPRAGLMRLSDEPLRALSFDAPAAVPGPR